MIECRFPFLKTKGRRAREELTNFQKEEKQS